MSFRCTKLIVLVALIARAWCGIAHATDYQVGPEQTLASLDKVPWEKLDPGDIVSIHYRPQPYLAKWFVQRDGTKDKPITIRGIPGPQGELPVIDGRNAVTRPSLVYWGGDRGIITVGGSDNIPAWIVIENLEIRSARPGFSFLGKQGVAEYSDSAASIYIEKGEHITVRNCVLHDSANGLFSATESREVTVEGCHIHSNGVESSVYQHNSYTESAGMTYQFNRFGRLRERCRGNNLKDRSAGLVVRYNWIEGGNRQLDLVEAQGSAEFREDPRWNKTLVYGNTLIEYEGNDNNQIVHFGGDSGDEPNYRVSLEFYNNTVISHRLRKTCLIRLSTANQQARLFNNIVYLPEAPGAMLGVSDENGQIEFTDNWLKPGWKKSHGTLAGTVTAERNTTGDEPGFVDFAQLDLRLRSDSPCREKTRAYPKSISEADQIRFQFRTPHFGTPRRVDGKLDLGAFGPPSKPKEN